MEHRPFREQDLLFFGATTAGVSHELKNIISIINESAGLLHDFATAAERGRPLDPLRVKKTSADIARNVGRAVDVIDRLNRFAHSADQGAHRVDLRRLVLDVVALAERTTGLRGRTIRAMVPESGASGTAYPFGLHQAIFLALKLAADATATTAEIAVHLDKGAHGRVIRILPVPAGQSEAAKAAWQDIASSVAEFGGRADRTTHGGTEAVEISVPDDTSPSAGA